MASYIYAGACPGVVALNRAIAVAEIARPAGALAVVDGLDLGGYYLLRAVCADLLGRLDRHVEAAEACGEAIATTANVAEPAYVKRRRRELAGS